MKTLKTMQDSRQEAKSQIKSSYASSKGFVGGSRYSVSTKKFRNRLECMK
jgi:hypothetical protein